jgi:malate synthase
MHYHQVDVPARQQQLAQCLRASLDDILTIPLLGERKVKQSELMMELENNAQGILGYVKQCPGNTGLRGALDRPGRRLFQGARYQ